MQLENEKSHSKERAKKIELNHQMDLELTRAVNSLRGGRKCAIF